MTNGWQTVQLGKVLRVEIDAVPVDAQPEFHMAGVYSFARGLFKREALPNTQTTYKFFHRLHIDMYVISVPKGWEGALARVTDDFEGMFLSPVFPTFRANPEEMDIQYLEWYCRQSKVWEELRRKSRGIGARRESVSAEQFLSLEIPLPPLTEQRQIVARIESLGRLANEAQRLREEVEEGIRAFVASYHVHYSDTVVKLGDILTLDEVKEIIKPEDSYPQIGVKGFGKGLFARETLPGTQTTYKWFNRLYYGAVVLSQVKGWEGAIGVVDKSLVGKFASPEYRTFRCKPNQALPEYLSELFATPWFYLQLKTLSRGVGGRRERIRPELFVELEIPMPDIERQKLAVEIFARFPALRELQSASGEELSALMPSILDKAFKGEL